jgi:hypothetical protein
VLFCFHLIPLPEVYCWPLAICFPGLYVSHRTTWFKTSSCVFPWKHWLWSVI